MGGRQYLAVPGDGQWVTTIPSELTPEKTTAHAANHVRVRVAQHTALNAEFATWILLCGLSVEFHVGPRVVGFRVVVRPGREAAMTRRCTNLPRTPFSLDLVGRLYRFRWQIERCFKEWKSYANLHQFDTANVPIAEGLDDSATSA